MPDLFADIKSAVMSTIARAGEDPADYDVNRIVASTPLLHGQIVRDYRGLLAQGYTVRGAIQTLTGKYNMKADAVHMILKRERKGK